MSTDDAQGTSTAGAAGKEALQAAVEERTARVQQAAEAETPVTQASPVRKTAARKTAARRPPAAAAGPPPEATAAEPPASEPTGTAAATPAAKKAPAKKA